MAKVHVIVPSKWCHTLSSLRWSSTYSSTQRQSSAYSSAPRWSSAYSSGEVSNVLYGGSLSLDWQAGAPKGHLPHRGNDGIHVCHPHGLMVYNATGTHHGYNQFDCHFQSQGFWGYLEGSCWQWVPS